MAAVKKGAIHLGPPQSQITTKLHLAISADNKVVEGQLAGGNVADISMAADLTADVVGCTDDIIGIPIKNMMIEREC